MDETPAYRLDIDGLNGRAGELPTPEGAVNRPWVGIRFECCKVYTRLYRNAEGTSYEGRCPHCGMPVTLRVGPGGTSARFFSARPN